MEYTRAQLIALLEQNDSNGCYSDQDCMMEIGAVLSYEILIELATDQELIRSRA